MNTPADTMDMISTFLTPVREKLAAEESYQDNDKNNVQGNDKVVATDSQTNLGKEQSADAKDSGSTVEDESDNTDALSASPVDDQGTHTLTTDDPVTSGGNVGPIVHQEISQTQKTASDSARMINTGNAVVAMLSKVAKELDTYPQSVAQHALEKSAAEKHVDDASAVFAHYYALGMEKRAHDEAEMSKVQGWDRELRHMGGPSALLDKIAMETPEAVLPPEALAGDALPIEGEDAPLMEGEGDMLAEGGDDALLEELAQALAAEDITPEDLEMAIQDAQALESEGVSDDELAQAIGGDAEGGMGEVEKEASQANERIGQIRQFIYRNR
jgi:hypothetical protein